MSLCCEATGSPSPKIEWSRAQPSSDLLPDFQQNGCLEVNPVVEKTQEGYICRATNPFGLAETTTSLIKILTGCSFPLYLRPFTFGRFCFILPFENPQNYVYTKSDSHIEMIIYERSSMCAGCLKSFLRSVLRTTYLVKFTCLCVCKNCC